LRREGKEKGNSTMGKSQRKSISENTRLLLGLPGENLRLGGKGLNQRMETERKVRRGQMLLAFQAAFPSVRRIKLKGPTYPPKRSNRGEGSTWSKRRHSKKSILWGWEGGIRKYYYKKIINHFGGEKIPNLEGRGVENS